MSNTLLISETYIKGCTNIDDNFTGKLIQPAIVNAQEIELRGILGDSLIDKIKTMVYDESIKSEDNIAYKDLLDKAQPFLAYTVVAELIMLTACKISPAGNEVIDDEKMTHLSINESYQLQSYYQKKADYYCKILQNFILQHKGAYPELTENCCASIKANLHSSASTGVWLGGVRGTNKTTRRLRNKYGC